MIRFCVCAAATVLLPPLGFSVQFETVREEVRRMPGLERYYTFEEGKWTTVENLAPRFPGKLSRDGGPLGSLSIKRLSPYGQDYDAYEPRRWNPPGTLQPKWVRGRVPGKSALCLGTRADTTYRSGVTGDEFQKGWTFVAWAKASGKDPKDDKWSGLGDVFNLGDAYHEGCRLSAGRWNEKDARGSAAIRLALPPKGGKPHVLTLTASGFSGRDWHCVAATWDGSSVRLYIDGRLGAVTNGVTETFCPVKFPKTWCGTSPFDEECIRNCFRLGGSRSVLVTLDEFAAFSRALTEDELKVFLKVRPVAQPVEPDMSGISLDIPRDSNGYFRVNDRIPVSVAFRTAADAKLVAGCRLKVHLETLEGRQIEDRIVDIASGGQPSTFVSFGRCDVYYIDLSIVDAAGSVVKGLDEPYPVGIVPPAPKTLDSPFALWATEDAFHYDMNLRRIFLWYPWNKGKSVTTENWDSLKTFRETVRRFREKQGLGDRLKMFMCFCLKPGMRKTFTDEEKDVFRHGFELQVAVAKEHGIRMFEVTSEINNHLCPEGYVEQLKILVPIIRREIPDAIVFPPGATPNAIPYINRLLTLGATDLVDGVSIHPYCGLPIEAYHRKSIGKELKKVCANHPKKDGSILKIYNTESGVFCLPRVEGRPMTRDVADRTILARTGTTKGFHAWCVSMIILPEAEAAALQCAIPIMDFATGFETYAKCQHGSWAAIPSLQGVAMTALSGQVLNHMVSQPRALKLPTLDAAAVVFDRPSEKERHVMAVLANWGYEETLNFRVRPNAKFRLMDLYGNFSTVSANADGLLTVKAEFAPKYVFGVPGDIEAQTIMSLDFPVKLPENGRAKGTLTVKNPLGAKIAGALAVTSPRGTRVELAEKSVSLAPGEERTIGFAFAGERLKSKSYSLKFSLDDIASVERVFESEGVITILPSAKGPLPMDGDLKKWSVYPEQVAETEEEVSVGKPNLAEQWVPQWKNAEDLSLRVRAAYVRGESVRFVLEVADDALVPVPEANRDRPFYYDCLELFVDTRTGRELGTTVSTGADQIVISPSFGETLAPCTVWYPKGDDRRVDVTCLSRRTKTGYLVEGEIRPAKGSEFRCLPGSRMLLDWVVDDCDRPSVTRKTVMGVHGTVSNQHNVKGWGRYELGE